MKNRSRVISLALLTKVWKSYREFRRPQLSPATIRRDYLKIERRLKRIQNECPDLDNAIAIRDWLLEHYSHEIARRTLVQLNACCKWAMDSELISRNPFAGLPAQIRPPRRTEKQWAAFTTEERDRIIQEFQVKFPRYAPWVQALFWTGARPEELAALRWEHISQDFREILFVEAFPVDMKEAQSTKNYKTTRFPCNIRLQGLIRSQWESLGRPPRDSFVFPGLARARRFDYHNFQTRYWKPLVEDLRDHGLISFYLSQYHARHTFITEGLKAGISVPDMAYLVRTSPQIIYRHYLDRTRSIVIPEF